MTGTDVQLLILDLHMPDALPDDPLGAIAASQGPFPSAAIVVLCACEDPITITAAIRRSARRARYTFLLKP